MNDPRHRCNGECGHDELVAELYEDIGVGAGEEELLSDPSAAELEYAEELDPSAAELELDPELFEGTPIVRAVEPALVAGKIAQGERNENELTNFVFFLRHPELPKAPLRAGQETLMQEWKSIRDEVVRPMLARFAGGSTAVDPSTPNVPLGKLVCSVPGRPVFTYQFTPDDLITAARFLVGEAGGKDDAYNLGTLWAMLNRYAFHGRGSSWGSFAGLLRAYSQTLKPIAKHVSMKPFLAKCNATFDNAGCQFQPNSTEVYPGTTIRQGNLRNFLRIQKLPWSGLPEGARRVALRALTGGAQSNVGNAGHVAGTDVYFARKHGRKPTRAEWEKFTHDFAKEEKLAWRPHQIPFDQFVHHALFVDKVAKAFPEGVVRVVAPSGVQTPTQTPSQTPTQAPPTSGGTFDGKTPAPGTTEKRRSYPASPPLRNAPGNRSRATYNAVIDQFAAGTNPRYAQKRDANNKIVSTYCNIFAWDITSAMGAEIPHWIDKQGNPVGFNKGNELNANATNKWLHRHGSRFGWRKVTLDDAVARANAGYPVVASWANPKGIGHIAVIRPGNPDPIGGPWMAQAGAVNASWIRLWAGGKDRGVWRRGANVETFTHD